MTEGTRGQEARHVESSIWHLRENSDKQAKAITELRQLVAAMNLKYEQLISKSPSQREDDQAESMRQLRESSSSLRGSIQTQFAKIDFPRFNGDDPKAWAYRCEKSFDFNQIDVADKVQLASIHLEDKALQWFRWLEKTTGPVGWVEFVQALNTRFGPTAYEDSMGELKKLSQTSSVKQYQEKFEELVNRTNGLPEKFFVSCFISGLRDEIEAGVRMFKLTTINEAIGLARLQEGNIEAIARRTKGNWKSLTPSPTNTKPIVPPSLPPIRRLTQAEMDERKSKGLCYNCDERYSMGHRCKWQQIFLLEGVDDEPPETSEEIEEPPEEELQISVYALAGSTSYHTMRIKGYIKRRPVTILIDSGSTHNFLDPEVAKRTECDVQPTNPLSVSVANGTKLISSATCKGFQWVMQGTNFQADMRLLPLGGCDMVLGIQWLSTLGPIIWDFNQLQMEFSCNDRLHVLRGSKGGTVQLVDSNQMKKILRKPVQGAVAQLFAMQTMEEICANPEMATLLHHYSDIFAEPHGLPPSRSHDHCIPLKEGSEPTNVRPYRYPNVQKNEIEKVVREMLAARVSVPVLVPFLLRF
ncbi:uncharacterized protein LOC143869781 [Tasmannia lanceolata]|uniref:uncharacterized protein LOC143869781 n=1 Tax=Tasmannia lanceolata TaxID=3420 RepID=UPI004063A1CD